MMWWIIGAVVAVIYLFTWALCVAAGRADDEMDRWLAHKENDDV